jgi:hypothetical protein
MNLQKEVYTPAESSQISALLWSALLDAAFYFRDCHVLILIKEAQLFKPVCNKLVAQIRSTCLI